MSSAERNLKNSFTFTGILLMVEGFLFVLVPHLATKLLFFAPLETAQAEQYARTTGFGIAAIGNYYFVAGKYTLIDFFRASIVGRLFVLPITVMMTYLGFIEAPFIAIGIQDLVTAIWSYTCLKAYETEKAKNKK